MPTQSNTTVPLSKLSSLALIESKKATLKKGRFKKISKRAKNGRPFFERRSAHSVAR